MFRKRVKNKQFDYIPRFYDPVKEDLDARLSPYDEEKKDVDRLKSSIRSRFQRKSRVPQSQISGMRMRSNIRLFMIIGVLCLVSYLMLKSDAFLGFVESLNR